MSLDVNSSLRRVTEVVTVTWGLPLTQKGVIKVIKTTW